jgi:hypothetical protein
MADITMCNPTDCPIKDKCYRFTAIPGRMQQVYFVDAPGKIIEGEFKCEHFWGNLEDVLPIAPR